MHTKISFRTIGLEKNFGPTLTLTGGREFSLGAIVQKPQKLI